MNKNVPYIISQIYKEEIAEICASLPNIGLSNFVMYTVFSDNTRFVLSNMGDFLIPYYFDKLYLEDYSYKPQVIQDVDYYLCNVTECATPKFRDQLENRFSFYRAYYIVRRSPEMTFVFGALKNRKFDNHYDVYRSTIGGFENFCIEFVKRFRDVIIKYNPAYRLSFVLNNNHILRSIIKNNANDENVLTDREIDCLWLVSQGYSSKAVAAKLKIATPTVERHLKNSRGKMKCKNTVQTVTEAIARGYIGALTVRPEKENINTIQIIEGIQSAKRAMKMTSLALLNSA